MNRVVVTLTTIPPRLHDDGSEGIKLCIESLISQNYGDYEVHMNIPHVNKFTNEDYIIPNWLTDIDKVQIFRVEDTGPPTKLIPTVERLIEANDIIIVVDDDTIYHPDMVLEQVNNQIKFPRAVVGYDGMRSRNDDGSFSGHFGDPRDYYYSGNYRDSKVDILQHYKSVSYKRGYFLFDFFDFVKDNHSWNDDLLMAAYFSHKKRDRIATYHPNDIHFNSYDEWTEGMCVSSFPILKSTSHHSDGCATLRLENINDNLDTLHKYIDKGYSIDD